MKMNENLLKTFLECWYEDDNVGNCGTAAN